ncbi:BET1-like protein isoform X2 [Neopelma chrysocephalum]|uniref:BET1-like protein isoform X2 n=1 Tax=Neopelma chrysocephalum TaxID=114329 RepID=UPI000FCD1569|nr:BET1-like protein isoform X2 [Neopelma chrysocephalum]
MRPRWSHRTQPSGTPHRESPGFGDDAGYPRLPVHPKRGVLGGPRANPALWKAESHGDRWLGWPGAGTQHPHAKGLGWRGPAPLLGRWHEPADHCTYPPFPYLLAGSSPCHLIPPTSGRIPTPLFLCPQTPTFVPSPYICPQAPTFPATPPFRPRARAGLWPYLRPGIPRGTAPTLPPLPPRPGGAARGSRCRGEGGGGGGGGGGRTGGHFVAAPPGGAGRTGAAMAERGRGQSPSAMEDLLDVENKRMADSLASKVTRLKSLALDIDKDAEEQNRYLDGMLGRCSITLSGVGIWHLKG